MSPRRSLIEGVKATVEVDPDAAKKFIYGDRSQAAAEPSKAAPANALVSSPTQATPHPLAEARTPVNARIRSHLAAALKRASLERQLAGLQPYMVQDILETALEPWLRDNGYLS